MRGPHLMLGHDLCNELCQRDGGPSIVCLPILVPPPAPLHDTPRSETGLQTQDSQRLRIARLLRVTHQHG